MGKTFIAIYLLRANNWKNAHIENDRKFRRVEKKVNKSTSELLQFITWECSAAGTYPLPTLVAEVNGKIYRKTRTIVVVPNPQYAKEYTAGKEWLYRKMQHSAYKDSLYLEVYRSSKDWVLFNDVNNRAFVLVAAAQHWQPNLNPILAWSTDNSYNYSEIKNHQQDAILANYTQQLSRLSGATEDYSLSLSYRRQQDTCPPLLKELRWGQNAPYNSETPLDSEGKHSPVGCVPIAVSQILKYHQAAVKPNTSVHYKDVSGKIYTFTFDAWQPKWEEMRPYYAPQDSTAEETALTMMMVGLGLNARFGADATSANLNKIKPFLCNNFGFHPSMQALYEAPDSTIVPLVYRNIDQGMPCIVSWGGHAFIADGYDHGYLHYNLGWGGVCNGWYQQVLSPDSSAKQGLLRHAVVGIRRGAEPLRKDIVVSQAGTLATLLTAEGQTAITHLRLAGSINGDDIKILRKMASENLSCLDLSKATIVKGKNPYLSQPAEGVWTHTATSKYGLQTAQKFDLSKPMTKAEWSEFRLLIGKKKDGISYAYDELTGRVIARYYTEENVIGYYMFDHAEALQSLILPKNTRYIHQRAFTHCVLLRQLTIPQTVRKIEKNAVAYCPSLEEVELLNRETISVGNFTNCSPVFKLKK